MKHIKIISFKVFFLAILASAMLYTLPVLADSASINGVKLENDEILIEAGQIDYDQEKGLALASHDIALTIKANGGQLQAESLSYDIEAGVITATGSVRFTTGDVVCETGSITYNLRDATGTTGAFKGKLTGHIRDISLNGEALTVGRGPASINNAGVTRCPLSNPHYKFFAKKITVNQDKARLIHVILSIKGVPVFYFPSFTLTLNKAEQESAAKIQVGFSGDEGLWLEYANILPTKNENLTWNYDARLATKGLNFGLGFKAFGNLSNHLNFDYDFNGIWTVKDVASFTYDSPLASFVINAERDFSNSKANDDTRLRFNITKDTPAIYLSIDGIKSLSSDKEAQLGFSLTRKYWKGLLGEWQIGIQGRQVSKVDENEVEYGGTYGGYQIDYKPNAHFNLGYLQLLSFSGKNYGDFEPNIGRSILYSADLPIGKEFSIGISGTYNFDESKLKSQILRFKQDTCCYTFSVSWDTVSNTWSVGPAFKF